MTETKWLASTDPAAMLGWLCDPGKPHAHRPSKRKQRLFACACCRGALAAANVTDNRPLRTVAALEREADGEWLSELTRDRMRAAEMREEVFVNRQQGLPAVHMLSRAEKAAWSALDALCILDDDTGTGLPVNVGGFLHAFGRAHANAVGADPNAVAADLLREIVGNPFRPHNRGQPWLGIAAMAALSPEIQSLATAAYEHRTPQGHLEPARLAVLADALEEAGCQEETLLQHLRGVEWCRACGGSGAFRNSIGPCDVCRYEGVVPLRGPHVRGCWVTDVVLGKG